MSPLSLLFLARLGILEGGGGHIPSTMKYSSVIIYTVSMPGWIMDGTLLISPPFTFGLNLLFVFGDEDINTEG